jgi:hypothetical protein
MKYLFRVLPNVTRHDLGTLNDAGWRKYVPGLGYDHIISSFLLPMHRLVVESTDLDLQAISGNRGFAPYSVEEFHDIFAEQFERVLTNGNESQRALVFHTTPSYRTRNVGWYHPFGYHRHTIANIPDPLQNAALATDANTYADCFWTGLCKVTVIVTLAAPDNGVPQANRNDHVVNMSIGHILVGKMILKHFGSLLGTRGVILSRKDVKKMHVMKISTNHTLKDLWPDYQRFYNFVRNCMRSNLKWDLHPFTSGSLNENQRIQQRCKFQLCSDYKIQGVEEGLSEQLGESINMAITDRKLDPILEVGAKGMNSQYVNFLLGLRDLYDERCAELCGVGGRSCQRVTSDLCSLWRNGVNILPESMQI